MAEVVFIILVLAGAMALAMREAPLWLWALFAAAVVFTWQSDLLTGNFHSPDPGFLGLLAWLPAVLLGLLAVPSLRRSFLIEPAFRMVKGILPRVSDTEQQALDAGTVGFDAELFSGQPDWDEAARRPAASR